MPESRKKAAAGNAPVWLFTGPENGEKNAELETLRRSAGQKTGGLEEYRFHAGDIKAGDLVSLLQNGSLFSAGKFVVVRDAEAFRLKEEITMLTDWIASVDGGGNGVYLVLLSDEISVDKRLENAVPKAHRKIFWEMFEDRKEQWLVSFFRKEGLSIDGDAVRFILEQVENNTEALRAACMPFALFYGKGTHITEAEAEHILSHNRSESPFTLFDALAKGDLENAVQIQRKLSLSRESAPPQTIAGLAYCFRRLADWHKTAEQAGGRADSGMLKRAGFTSTKAQNQYRMAAARWDAETVRRILAMLAAADEEARSTGDRLQNTAFEFLLYKIAKAGEKGSSAAQTEKSARGRITNARERRF